MGRSAPKPEFCDSEFGFRIKISLHLWAENIGISKFTRYDWSNTAPKEILAYKNWIASIVSDTGMWSVPLEMLALEMDYESDQGWSWPKTRCSGLAEIAVVAWQWP